MLAPAAGYYAVMLALVNVTALKFFCLANIPSSTQVHTFQVGFF